MTWFSLFSHFWSFLLYHIKKKIVYTKTNTLVPKCESNLPVSDMMCIILYFWTSTISSAAVGNSDVTHRFCVTWKMCSNECCFFMYKFLIIFLLRFAHRFCHKRGGPKAKKKKKLVLILKINRTKKRVWKMSERENLSFET